MGHTYANGNRLVFLKENQVAIGWPELGNILKIDPTRVAFKKVITETYPNTKRGAVPVEAGILYRFIVEVQPNDYVIYPSKHDRMVNIGKFTGKILHITEGNRNEASEEFPNAREVKWLGQFPRSDFSQAALYEIGSFITLFTVRKHASEFLNKIDGSVKFDSNDALDEEDIPDDDSVTSNVSKQAEETTHDYIIKKIYSGLDGYEFEYFTAHLLECMGYHARVSNKSGDGGVDIVAHLDELGFHPPIIIVQCKRITSQSGEPEVNQLLGILGEGEFALFVNLGSYSRAARLLERNRAKLRLIDGEQLVELVLEHYSKMSAKYRTLIPLKQIYVPDIME